MNKLCFLRSYQIHTVHLHIEQPTSSFQRGNLIPVNLSKGCGSNSEKKEKREKERMFLILLSILSCESFVITARLDRLRNLRI